MAKANLIARKENILWFKDIKKEDIPSVGGKGANLGEMAGNFPVPDGFCVTVNSYKKFLEDTGVGKQIFDLLAALKVEDTEALDTTSKKIRDLIMKQEFPEAIKKELLDHYNKLPIKTVAIRSSATAEDLPTASFAGQQDTYLFIEGEDKVVHSVQKCWASLFTSRAIYYREHNKFKHEDVLISVVVQIMIDPKYAGVMFTLDPVHKKFILIEFVEGVGEKLVSGEVTPNTYFMDKKTHKVSEKSLQFEMDTKMAEDVSLVGEKIEDHYKMPMDVEFAYDNDGKLWILQARPITTL
ncbi:MAG: hypothetical protein KKG59_06595 [Nanoarchaeota archaeon]|nr:hypothetical protein [Nanoarchaeota archaeon]